MSCSWPVRKMQNCMVHVHHPITECYRFFIVCFPFPNPLVFVSYNHAGRFPAAS